MSPAQKNMQNLKGKPEKAERNAIKALQSCIKDYNSAESAVFKLRSLFSRCDAYGVVLHDAITVARRTRNLSAISGFADALSEYEYSPNSSILQASGILAAVSLSFGMEGSFNSALSLVKAVSEDSISLRAISGSVELSLDSHPYLPGMVSRLYLSLYKGDIQIIAFSSIINAVIYETSMTEAKENLKISLRRADGAQRETHRPLDAIQNLGEIIPLANESSDTQGFIRSLEWLVKNCRGDSLNLALAALKHMSGNKRSMEELLDTMSSLGKPLLFGKYSEKILRGTCRTSAIGSDPSKVLNAINSVYLSRNGNLMLGGAAEVVDSLSETPEIATKVLTRMRDIGLYLNARFANDFAYSVSKKPTSAVTYLQMTEKIGFYEAHGVFSVMRRDATKSQ